MLRTFLLSVTLVSTSALRAQATDVEVFGGLGFLFPRLDSTYDASYTPSRVVGINQIFADPDPRSTAHQLLTLQGKTSPAFGGGVNVFPHAVLGFQFLSERANVDIAGDNPPHDVELTYDTIAFPNPDRIVATTSYQFEQPDTEGSLEETTLSFNLAARFGTGGVVSGNVSGGLSYARFRVEAERMGAFAAWLGGHAVLFSELYEMSYATETADAIGFNVGGQVDVSIGPHVAVFADGRWVQVPKTGAVVRLDERLSTNVVTVPLLQVEDFLDLPLLEIDPSYLRLLFGLKLRF